MKFVFRTNGGDKLLFCFWDNSYVKQVCCYYPKVGYCGIILFEMILVVVEMVT